MSKRALIYRAGAGAAELPGQGLLADDQRTESARLYPQRGEKSALVALLARYNVMLIEDDVYSELYLAAKTAAGKILGPQDMTLHCSSFSKCLVPGFRIGWVAAGKHARRIQQLQLMSTLSPVRRCRWRWWITCLPGAMTPICAACVASWLSVNSRPGRRCCAICPPEVKIHHSDSGYFCGSNCRKGP
jgi:hypothetical protein